MEIRAATNQDTHLYRIGVNYRDLKVNRPKVPVRNYMRDGQFGGMRGDEGTGHPNYFPNSIEGSPQPDPSYEEPAWHLGDVTVDRWNSRIDHDDYTQAGDLYRLMSEEEKNRLASNIASSMQGVRPSVIERQLGHFDKADEDYGRRVREALKTTHSDEQDAARKVRDDVPEEEAAR